MCFPRIGAIARDALHEIRVLHPPNLLLDPFATTLRASLTFRCAPCHPSAVFHRTFNKKAPMSRSIGRYLVELLTANGIDTVFGIPGVHNLELYRVSPPPSIRHVLVRHEQGAGFAADGYARLDRPSRRPRSPSPVPGSPTSSPPVAQAYSDSIPCWWSPPRRCAPRSASNGACCTSCRIKRRSPPVCSASRAAPPMPRTCATTCGCASRRCVPAAPRPAYLEIPLDVLSETTDLAGRTLCRARAAAAGAAASNRRRGAAARARRRGP